jgi:hypothetical protein
MELSVLRIHITYLLEVSSGDGDVVWCIRLGSSSQLASLEPSEVHNGMHNK